MNAERQPETPRPETDVRDVVAIVIPCYNAGAALADVVKRACAVSRHVIVVDDGSTDGAVDKLQEDPVHIVRFEVNRGKGAALLAGFRAALSVSSVACVAVIDADGQHDPNEIADLYRPFLDEKADLVVGTRSFGEKRVPWASWFGNTMTRLVSACLLGRWVPDTQSGFRLHSRRFLDAVLVSIPEGRYETEMAILIKAVREGYVVLCIPIKTIYEPGNPSSHFDKLRDSWRIWRVMFTQSLRQRTRKSR